jgi:hypothetical protein
MKNNTLAWVGVISVLLVGGVLLVVMGKRGKTKNKDKQVSQKTDNSDEILLEGDAIVVGEKKIDLSKFNIDMSRISAILAQPVSKERKYELLKQSGVSNETVSLVQKADEAEKKKKLTKSLKDIERQKRDAEFEKLIGVKPRRFNVSTSIGG